MTPNWRPSRTARKLKERETKLKRKATERTNMNAVRKADKTCRFPLCGCKKLGLAQHVSHQKHRGMGGNPKGDRTQPENLIKLCFHRHQDGAISIHKGTLKIDPIDEKRGTRGPVMFWVDASEIGRGGVGWFLLATETSPGTLEPLSAEQLAIARRLAVMDL